MKMMFRLIICLAFAGACLYSFIDSQNEVTELRIKLPKLAKEIKAIEEENGRLHYEIEQFENPDHLMKLARLPEYSHLKHPLVKEIVTVKEGVALTLSAPTPEELPQVKPRLTLANVR